MKKPGVLEDLRQMILAGMRQTEFSNDEVAKIRDLTPDVMEAPGRPRAMSASFYKGTTIQERALFGNKNSLYNLPTVEQVEWLREFIGGRPALEIGAQHGRLAEWLGIRATDSRTSLRPEMELRLRAAGLPPPVYGANVKHFEATLGTIWYRPQVVVGAWVTHINNDPNHDNHGSMYGVDEEFIIRNCDAYVLIGNREVHKHKPILKLPHEEFEPDWLFSRSMSGAPEFIGIWRRDRL